MQLHVAPQHHGPSEKDAVMENHNATAVLCARFHGALDRSRVIRFAITQGAESSHID